MDFTEAAAGSAPSSSRSRLFYRLTGPQSIERLAPLIESTQSDRFQWICIDDLHSHSENIAGMNCTSDGRPRLDVVWETFCEKEFQDIHAAAFVRNRLHNSKIFESKSDFAFLQLTLSGNSKGVRMLETYVAPNIDKVRRWVATRWSDDASNDKSSSSGSVADGDGDASDWWVVKSSNANGGQGVWVINRRNHKNVLGDIDKSAGIISGEERSLAASAARRRESYVIQKYVRSPLLYRGCKKFHFRCYSVVCADNSSVVCRDAFILSAALDYSTMTTEEDMTKKHITNLSVNKRHPGHPGQVPVDVSEAYPEVFAKICTMWGELVSSAYPFLAHQSQSGTRRFDFYGIDIIADTFGDVWLIECNRLPGLESSNNNREAEDVMYNRMMADLLDTIIMPPLLSHHHSTTYSAKESTRWVDTTVERKALKGGETHINLLKWKLFTLKNRSKIVIL